MKHFLGKLNTPMNECWARGRMLLFERCAVALAILVALLLRTSESARAELPPPRVQASSAPVTAKLLRYAQYIVRQYDTNKTGQLEPDEWRSMQGQPQRADSNHDGLITLEEFAQYCANYGAGRAIRLSTLPGDLATHDGSRDSRSRGDDARSSDAAAPDASKATANAEKQDRRRETKYFASLPSGVPQWFVQRDADGDGQLTLSEYSPKLLTSEIDEFNRYDSNRDGILTAQEFLRAGKDAKSKAPATVAGEPARAAGP